MFAGGLTHHQTLNIDSNTSTIGGEDWAWRFDMIDRLTLWLNPDCQGPLSLSTTSGSTPSLAAATPRNHYTNETRPIAGLYSAEWASLVLNQTSSKTTSSPQPLSFEDPLFHLASALLLVSYLAPSSKWGQVYLHTGLTVGFLVLSTWAWNIVCAPEVFAWYFAFTVLNSGQLIYILYQMRPITFDEDLENIFQELFLPMKISRAQFKRLVGGAGVKETSPTFPNYSANNIAQIVSLHTGECYAIQDMTKTDRLALLIAGRVNVVNDRTFLHHIIPGQFLDSPEFESSSCLTISGTSPGTTGLYGSGGSGPGEESAFKVTICAAVSSRCLVWQRAALEYLLRKDTHLAAVMSTLISSDITDKLYSMNSRLKAPGVAGGAKAHLDIRLPGLAAMLAQADPLQMARVFQTDPGQKDQKISQDQNKVIKGKNTNKKATLKKITKASSVSSGLSSLSHLRRATLKKVHASSTSDLLKKVTSTSLATTRHSRNLNSSPQGRTSAASSAPKVPRCNSCLDRTKPLSGKELDVDDEGDPLLGHKSEISQSALSVS